MALALATASRLKPEVRLGQAISEFVADLSDEQKARFNAGRSQALASPPSIQDVRSLTAEIDRVSGGRCLGPRLIKLLETVQRFVAIGDIMVGGSQNIIACGVWSLVRLSLLLLTNSSSQLEKLSVLFMNVGRSAPRFEKIAVLYSRSRDLQSSVFEYFIVVVRLCHDILKFKKRSTFQKLGAALSDPSFEKYNSEIDSCSKTIQDEVRYLMARRTEEEAEATSRFRNASELFFRSASAHQKVQSRQRILDFCCQFDYMVPWKRIRKAGNTGLFRDCPKYKSWIGQPNPSTLIYTGKVGAGKSVMLANMVDDLHLNATGENMAVTFFFARHDIPKTLNARTIIGSLVQQLLDKVTDFMPVAQAFETSSRKEPFERMFCLLESVLPRGFKAFIVIDGLDELSDSEGEETLRHLMALQNFLNFSLCLSYRQEPNTSLKLKVGLGPFNAKIAPIPHNTSEIESFITEELGRRIETHKLATSDPLLPLEIREALAKGSQGMFLWVALQIESLCTMETDEEIRQALDDLPKDLSETFSRILKRSNKSDSPYQKWILELVTVAQRPLTAEELQEALSVTPGETKWSSSRLLNNIYHALEYCGGLVILDEEELTLHLVHHSFRQYLTTKTDGSTGKGVDVESAHKRMSEIIITYLHTVDITRNAVIKEVFPELGAESVMTGIINSARSSLHGSNKLALKLLRSKSVLELNMGKTLAKAWNISHRQEDHNLFRDYAHAFWHVHVTWSLPLSAQFKSLLQRLCDQKIFSPIGAPSDLQDLFLKAVSTGSTELTRYLLKTQALNVNCKTHPDQRTALHIAVIHGFSDIITVILTSDTVDVKAIDRNAESPLELAARIGTESTVLPFITGGGIGLRPDLFSSLLMKAAKEGYDLLLTQLLKYDEDDILRELMKQAWFAIQEATIHGHVSIVELLLRNSGTANCKSVMPGTNSLHAAVELGQGSIVTLLLQSGKIDHNQVNDYGWSPACLAVFCGNGFILKMLLNWVPFYPDRPAALHNGVTPLHLAAAIGDMEMVAILLAFSHVDLGLSDLRGNTPLHSAVRCDFNNMVEDVTALNPIFRRNYVGLPFYDIPIARHFEIVQRLAHDPNFAQYLNWQNDEGDTALHLAARLGHREVVGLLTDVPTVDPNQKNDQGDTALHLAARLGHHRVVELLTDIPIVDPNQMNNEGDTALHLAARLGRHKVVELLTDNPIVDPNQKNDRGYTVLHLAAEYGHRHVVELLAKVPRVDLNPKIHDGRTPLMLAIEFGQQEIVEQLLCISSGDVFEWPSR